MTGKRYALLLSGQARYRKRALDSIVKNIIEINDCDVFLHLWKNDESTRLPWDAIAPIANQRDQNTYQHEQEYIDAICEALPITRVEIEKQILFPVDKYEPGIEKERVIRDLGIEKATHHFRRCNFIIQSQWYSVYQANVLKTCYEHENMFSYDGVLRFRPDIYVPKPIDLSVYPTTHLHIPMYPGLYNLSDTVAYGSSSLIDTYSNFYICQDKILQDPKIPALLDAYPVASYLEKYVGIENIKCCYFNYDKNPVQYIQVLA